MSDKNIPHFETETDAWVWMEKEVDDGCVDNYRLCYLDDDISIAQYDEKKSEGCCGFFDRQVRIGNRCAMIGCNYGH